MNIIPKFWKIILFSTLILVSSQSASAQKLHIALVGDPQVDNAKELSYARNSIYKDLKNRDGIDMIILLGDIVNDNSSLLEPSVASMDSTGKEWYAVPGNHDFDKVKKIEGRKRVSRNLTSWKYTVGYSDTTFVKKGLKFILMSNILYSGGDYVAGFRDSQKAWLDSVITSTPQKQRIIFATHAPVEQMNGADSIAAIFSKHPGILAVNGHTHRMSRIDGPEELKLTERIDAGATCGSWWRGVPDKYGIPNARMLCGSPRGYYIATVKAKGSKFFDLDFINLSSDEQATARLVHQKDSTCHLLINVYAGKHSEEAEVFIPELGSKAKLAKETAAEVEDLVTFSRSHDRQYKRAHKELFIPALRIKSDHVWRIDDVDPKIEGQIITIIYNDGHLNLKEKVKIEKLEK